MTRTTRNQQQLFWWTLIAALVVMAWQLANWRIWVFTSLSWVAYELCFCPTTCSVQTRDSSACRNPATGRLFACTMTPGHQRLKWSALWRLIGFQRRTTSPRRGHTGRRRAVHKLTDVRVEPHQRVMLYLTIVGTVVTTVQTIAGIMDFKI